VHPSGETVTSRPTASRVVGGFPVLRAFACFSRVCASVGWGVGLLFGWPSRWFVPVLPVCAWWDGRGKAAATGQNAR